MNRGAASHAHVNLRTHVARRMPGGKALRRLEEERAYEGDVVRRLRRGIEERKETGAGRRARKLVQPSHEGASRRPFPAMSSAFSMNPAPPAALSVRDNARCAAGG